MNRRVYYPLFTDLHGRKCVVVGGGLVAERKVTTLLRFGASIVVVSPSVTRRLAASVRKGLIRHVARRFRPNDLQGTWLAYASTDDQPINELVSREAKRRRIFANIVDQPPLCSFIAPSIVKQGELVIAISTGGKSPTMAKKLRRQLEQSIGPSHARMVRLMERMRPLAMARLATPLDRKRYFKRLIESRALRLVKQGREPEARRVARRLLERMANHRGED